MGVQFRYGIRGGVLDQELTVKYLFPAYDSTWVLKPATRDYPELTAKASLEVLGVVTGVFRTTRFDR